MKAKQITLNVLVLNAQAAALKAFAFADAFSQRKTMTDEFTASGFDPLDFPTWENAFNSQLEMLTSFSRHDSPATIAAKKAAAKPA